MKKNTPRYLSVYNKIRDDILSGKYPAGSMLPPEGELEQIYGVSRTTIRSAIALLKSEKMIKVSQGRGTQVLPTEKTEADFNFPNAGSAGSVSIHNQFMLPQGYTTSAQGAVIDQIPADTKAAAALGLSPGAMVYRLQRVKFVNGTVFCYTVSHIPCELTPNLKEYNNEIVFLYQFLKDTYGISRTSSRINVSAVNAGFLESKLLDVPIGSPLLLNVRVAFCDEKPFEYNESFFRSDLMQITIDFSADIPLEE